MKEHYASHYKCFVCHRRIYRNDIPDQIAMICPDCAPVMFKLINLVRQKKKLVAKKALENKT